MRCEALSARPASEHGLRAMIAAAGFGALLLLASGVVTLTRIGEPDPAALAGVVGLPTSGVPGLPGLPGVPGFPEPPTPRSKATQTVGIDGNTFEISVLGATGIDARGRALGASVRVWYRVHAVVTPAPVRPPTVRLVDASGNSAPVPRFRQVVGVTIAARRCSPVGGWMRATGRAGP